MNDNITISNIAKKGAKLGSCGKMCNECAFKKNSVANLESHNVEKALFILEEISLKGESGHVFNCHIQGTFKKSEKQCVGFLYAKQFLLSYSD